jgi:ComF family protein
MGRAIVREMLGAVFEFCYPARCPACDKLVQQGAFLCDSCNGAMEKLQRQAACERCAMPLAEHGTPCPYCLGKGIPHYERVMRLGNFNDPLKDLVHQAKYRRRWPVAEQLAERLLQKPEARRALEEADCLVPVPLHPLRQIARGYNQAAVIAQELGRRCRVAVAPAAVRVRHTETQTHLHSRRERERNLRNAFALEDAASVEDRKVMVVDDVMTTGATLRSLGRVLRRGRPASLSAVVIAVADPHGRDFRVV